MSRDLTETATAEVTALAGASGWTWELADACAAAVVTSPELRVKVAYAAETYRWVDILCTLEQRRAELPDRPAEVRRPKLSDPAGLAHQLIAEASGSGRITLLAGRLREAGVRTAALTSGLHPLWHGPGLRVITEIDHQAAISLRELEQIRPDDNLPCVTGIPEELEPGDDPAAPHIGSLRSAREPAIAVAGQPVPGPPLTLETRAMLLHAALTGIEIASLEICAQNILVYRNAPLDFARDMARQAWDEGRHCAALVERLEQIGSGLGAYPPLANQMLGLVNGISLPLSVCAVQRIGEWRGLDALFRLSGELSALGDEESAQMILTQAHDETLHVGFGNRWLKAFTASPEETWAIHEAALELRGMRRHSVMSDAPPSHIPQWAAVQSGFDEGELAQIGWKPLA
jgi:uncharacterized ferritin-like protein (DUF455 family)